MTSKKHLPPPLKISALHSSNASIEIWFWGFTKIRPHLNVNLKVTRTKNIPCVFPSFLEATFFYFNQTIQSNYFERPPSSFAQLNLGRFISLNPWYPLPQPKNRIFSLDINKNQEVNPVQISLLSSSPPLLLCTYPLQEKFHFQKLKVRGESGNRLGRLKNVPGWPRTRSRVTSNNNINRSNPLNLISSDLVY